MNESDGGSRADNSSYNSYSQPTNINLPHGDNERYHRYGKISLLPGLYFILILLSTAAGLLGTSSRGQAPATPPLRDPTPTMATLGRWVFSALAAFGKVICDSNVHACSRTIVAIMCCSNTMYHMPQLYLSTIGTTEVWSIFRRDAARRAFAWRSCQAARL